MKTIYFIKTLLLFFMCFFFLSAKAAEKPALSLTPISDPRIDIPQNEQHLVQYKLSNTSDEIRTLSMKPIPFVTQELGKQEQCPLYITLKPGESCILTLKVDSQAKIEKGSPLLCNTGFNWFDDEITASSACVRPNPKEDMRVHMIPAGMASLSASIISNEKSKDKKTIVPGKTCFASMMACPLTMFANGGQGSLTITNTSRVVASNVQVISTFGSVTVAANNCPSQLGSGASCTIIFNPGATRGPGTITIQGVNTGVISTPAQVLGIGDAYQGGIIFQVNAGTNTGLIVATSDISTSHPWSTGYGQIGTTQNGFCNTQRIIATFPGTASAAGLCANMGYYLPSFDELESLIIAVLDNPTAANWNVSRTAWYWDSTEATAPDDPVTEATQAMFTVDLAGDIPSQSEDKLTLHSVRCIKQFGTQPSCP